MAKPAKTDDLQPTELNLALRQVRNGFLAVGGFSLFINLLMLVPSIYMLQVYDRAMGSRSNETLLMLTIILVILFVTLALLEMVRSTILVRIGNNIDANLGGKIFSSMFKLAIDRPGNQTAQPLNDLTTLRQYLTSNGPIAFFDGPWFPVYLAVLFMFHPMFGIFCIIAALVLGGIAIANEKLTGKRMASNRARSRSPSASRKA